MQDHEYSVIGHSRTSYGRYLGVAAAAIASGATAAGAGVNKLSASVGLPTWAQTGLVLPISVGATYFLVHWLFNKFGWRCLSWFSQVPDIRGKWDVAGKTIDDAGVVQHDWSGEVTISQNWEKIRVNIRTPQSASNSVSAALLPEPDGCWRLMYSYRNEPRMGEPELKSHVGHCELLFDERLTEAEGDYFNARGRITSGRMHLTKKAI